jgi:hypothetical protein
MTIVGDCAECRAFHVRFHAADGRRWRACRHCGDLFEVIPGPGRDPLYCTESHRQLAYRARRREREEARG